MKKLSVVIAFHKYKHFLRECLRSISESNYDKEQVEIVLIKDACEEHIDDLLQEYAAGMPLQVYELEEGHGVGAARNLGIAKAQSEYVYFLDSDDYVLEDTFAALLCVLEGGYDMVYGRFQQTWNNKANYLDKRAKKEAEFLLLSKEEQEEAEKANEERKAQRYQEYMEKARYHYGEQKDEAMYRLLKRRKGFRNMSALGIAYKTSFLREQNIAFLVDAVYYGDHVFVVECLNKANTFAFCEDSFYIKRKHNDPINYPALSQMEDETRFDQRIQMYEHIREKAEGNDQLRYLLDRKIVTYFVYHFARRLRRSEKPEWRKEYFPKLCEVLKGTKPEVLADLKRWQKKMVNAAMQNDLNKVLKLVRNRLARIKFKKILRNKNVFYKLAYYHIFLKKPLLNNVVLFETFMGKNYSDSPKYIYEYLAKHHSDQFTFVWVLNNKTKLPYGGKKVRRFSFRYAYYLARSKYLVFNVRQPLWYRKREGQVFLETWHGTPLKRLVFDQEEVTAASPKYKKEFYKQRTDWDYLISANDFSTETLRRCFMFEGEMLDVGYPRNDILYAEDREEKAMALKKKLGIPLDKKTILYAPTWRDDEHYGKGQYKFTLHLDLHKMKEALSDEYVLLLRTHHYIADHIDVSGLEGFTYNVSKYDDISEIYLISDICITDYSSVFFDYANLKRPILFYTYDIEKYKNQLRGFYIDMNKEVPGPLLYTSEEVIHAILHIEDVNKQYAERYAVFYDRFCHLDDGYASKRVAERVFLK